MENIGTYRNRHIDFYGEDYMKNKEVMTALGLSVALSVSACGTAPVQPEPVEEATEVSDAEEIETKEETIEEEAQPIEEKEEPAEPVEDNSKEEVAEQENVKEEAEEEPEFIIDKVDPVVMYGTQTANVRKGPSTDYDIVRQIQKNEEVTVIGESKADNGKKWYVLKTDDDSIEMISSSLLSAKKSGTVKQSNNTGNAGTAAPVQGDCAVADCDWEEEGDCGVFADGTAYCQGFCTFDNWNPADCIGTYCSASYCAQAE